MGAPNLASGLRPGAALRWLLDEWQWPYAAAFAACFLVALAPIVWSAAGAAAALIYLQLPAYMLHQLEEHGEDRFRRYVNQRVGRGREVLTPVATFAINLLGVWALMLCAFALAYYVDAGLGLIAVYLTALNALLHIASALATRAYNPGLWSALALFVPLSACAAIVAAADYDVSTRLQLIAVGAAVLAHVAIIVSIVPRMRS